MWATSAEIELKSGEPLSQLVLSPTPLPGSVRQALLEGADGATGFLELSGLRKKSPLTLLRALRARPARLLTVTGQEAELRLFRDFLVLVAVLAPAHKREILANDGGRSRIRLSAAPMALGRIAVGMAIGQLRLLQTRWYLGRGKTQQNPLPACLRDEKRCLFLKPLLMLGVAAGGSVGHVAGVANAISRRGTQVLLLSAQEQPMLNSQATQKRIEPPKWVALPSELNQLLYHHRFLKESTREVSTTRPDYLYLRYSLNDLTGPRLRSRFSVPLVVEFNGSEVWVQRNWGRPLRFQRTAEEIERAVLTSADLVVVVSEAVKEQALAAGVPEHRVLFYPNCVDSEIFDPARFDDRSRRETRAALGISEDADLFSFVGTFGRWHGTPVLASAIRRLIDHDDQWLHRRRVHFLFVGDGAEAEAVRSILGPSLGKPHVTLLGLQPQQRTPVILAASDALLSPHVPNPDGSRFFGSPTKLFEYMAMARPILASDLDQIGQVLRGWSPGGPPLPAHAPSEMAVLLKPGSVDNLIEGIRRVATMDRGRREQLGNNARAHVLRSFTWDRNVEEVLKRLRQLCPKTATGAPAIE